MKDPQNTQKAWRLNDDLKERGKKRERERERGGKQLLWKLFLLFS